MPEEYHVRCHIREGIEILRVLATSIREAIDVAREKFFQEFDCPCVIDDAWKTSEVQVP